LLCKIHRLAIRRRANPSVVLLFRSGVPKLAWQMLFPISASKIRNGFLRGAIMNTSLFLDLMLVFYMSGCSVAVATPAPSFEGLVADVAPVGLGPMEELDLTPDANASDFTDTPQVEIRDFTACQRELPKPFSSERHSLPEINERNDHRYEFLTW
jgi:hypothetical protein